MKKFYQLSKRQKMPSHLRDQFLRASSSIALNLSEGSAKPTLKDRKRFYHIALGSVREAQTVLRLAEADEQVQRKAEFLGICVYRLCRS